MLAREADHEGVHRHRRRLVYALAGMVGLMSSVLAMAVTAQASVPSVAWRYSGANLTSSTPHDFAQPASRSALDALRSTGSGTVAIVVTWYMPSPTSNAIAREPTRSPTDEAIRTAIAEASAKGFAVAVKPHVNVLDGSFRGEIRPTDPSRWFDAYHDFIIHYAEMAQAEGARLYEVGTELTSMQRHNDAWRALIADVRQRFDGELTYAANWTGGAEAVGFWDALDIIGVDAYMPLADPSDLDPRVADLVDAWKVQHRPRLERLAARWKKPVMFTELGYTKRLGTAASPASWSSTRPLDESVQARAYQAAYCAWSEVPWFTGIMWWEYRANGWDVEHSPRGKAAEKILRAWHSGQRPTCSADSDAPAESIVPPAVPSAQAGRSITPKQPAVSQTGPEVSLTGPAGGSQMRHGLVQADATSAGGGTSGPSPDMKRLAREIQRRVDLRRLEQRTLLRIPSEQLAGSRVEVFACHRSGCRVIVARGSIERRARHEVLQMRRVRRPPTTGLSGMALRIRPPRTTGAAITVRVPLVRRFRSS